VTFGGVAAAFAEDNDSQVTATAPVFGAASVVDVVVTTADGPSANTPTDDFTYFQPTVQIIETGAGTAVTEGGLIDSYSVLPTSLPTATVTVTIFDTPQIDATPNTLTFTPGDWFTAQVVTVTAIDDALIEGTHASVITHTVAGGGFTGAAISPVLVTITDNELGTPIVTQVGGSTAVTEGGVTDSITVSLAQQPSTTVTVTITGDAQVAASPTLLSFTPSSWNTPQTVIVSAIDDGVVEGAHTGFLSVILTGGVGIVPPSLVTVTISDNDARRVIVSAGGAETITFTPIDDAQISRGSRDANFGDESLFTVDDDPRRDGLLRFAVTGLAQRSVSRVILRLYVRDQSNSGGKAFATTSSTWNEQSVTWNNAPGFAGSAIDEIGSVSDNTWVEFNLTTFVTGDGIVSLRLRSDSANRVDYAAKEFGGGFAPQLLIDVGGSASLAINEGGPAGSYTVVLSSVPAGVATVSVVPDQELSVAPPQLQFTVSNWNLPQTVFMSAIDDDDIEGAHIGTIQHSVSGGGYAGVVVASVSAQITDNDAAGVRISESGGATSTNEDGLTDTYTVVLLGRPSGTVTITIEPDGELRTNLSQITFTTANWNIPQTVRVEAMDDSADEGTHTGRISHSAFGGGFNAVSIADVIVTITDNDEIVVEVITLSRGLTLVGWFGVPTTSRAIIESNARIIAIWFWDDGDQAWLLDSPNLPEVLRVFIRISRGDGFFVDSTSVTFLEVPLA